MSEAATFIDLLHAASSEEERTKIQRYFKTDDGAYGAGDVFIGVRMGDVFKLAKQAIDMPLDQVEALLESELHEARAGACSIMDKKARRKKTTEKDRAALYELYRRRIERINNWDLVDLAAPWVVGGYLFDKDHAPIYELAKSKNQWERRTAIYATGYIIRQGELNDTYTLAELLINDDEELINDDEELIHKAVGGWIREAGKKDRPRLIAFLDEHAAEMPRTMLRYSIEHLDPADREHYRGL
jgi:3-methyladenine DNA glycosylase AlkD